MKKIADGEVAEMVDIAITRSTKPPKAISMDSDMSLSAIHKAIEGTRQIPAKAMRAFSKTNLIAATSMALQSTGLGALFQYRKSDRHVQSRIVELEFYDRMADESMHDLPVLLFNKETQDDLTDEDKDQLIEATQRLAARANVSINLLMELDVRFNLNLIDILAQEKAPMRRQPQQGKMKKTIYR
jgi:hypothetical protein